MTFKDLPESLQLQITAWSDAYLRTHTTILPTDFLKHLDEAMAAGIVLEATRHNSKAEVLWQNLTALRNIFEINVDETTEGNMKILSLVDQCLIENKPETLVP